MKSENLNLHEIMFPKKNVEYIIKFLKITITKVEDTDNKKVNLFVYATVEVIYNLKIHE